MLAQPELDALAVVDLRARRLRATLALGPTPAPDAQGHFAPYIAPRTVALAGDVAFTAGERSGRLYRARLGAAPVVEREAAVCARPFGVVASEDGSSVWVSCAADEEVLRVDGQSLQVLSRARVEGTPWALALSADERTLAVARLHGGAVTLLEARTLATRGTPSVPDVAPRGNRVLAHGLVRSVYDVLERPGHPDQWWLAHELHGNDTPQPELDFESTIFAAFSVLRGREARTYTVDSRLANHPGERDGDFADVLSGPRALAFLPDRQTLLVLAQGSEDLLLFDVERGVEVGLLRPVPGDWPQGLAVSPEGDTVWIDARNSGQLVPVRVRRREQGGFALDAGEPLEVRPRDPMPLVLRLGQRVFHTANDSEIPITTNRWVACASCHPEGTTDRVTWRFSQGPRDTPSNAGGPDGFLFRTADRRDVTEYWRTIRIEQGGHFMPDDEVLLPYLHAVAAYVQQAIPVPSPPTLDAAAVARGRALFERADVGCLSCHPGPRGTDSGAENPTLDLAGPVRRWDVGTCAREGSTPDRAHTDFVGHPREACLFDTTALLGLAESPPYLHDGSAATLREVLTTRNAGDRHGRTSQLSAAEVDDLVSYLRSR